MTNANITEEAKAAALKATDAAIFMPSEPEVGIMMSGFDVYFSEAEYETIRALLQPAPAVDVEEIKLSAARHCAREGEKIGIDMRSGFSLGMAAFDYLSNRNLLATAQKPVEREKELLRVIADLSRGVQHYSAGKDTEVVKRNADIINQARKECE